jgi:diguanylate cyclase (GGDEF)-like protein
MDYPVLVNPGKPSWSKCPSERNRGPRRRRLQRAANRLRPGEKRQAREVRGGRRPQPAASPTTNRRGFERELVRSIAFIKRYGASGALLVLDVDRLKPINDAFGHAAGDQVLKAVVKTLLSQVRASDVIGRLGGDEFALLLWNLSETDARAKAAALEEAIDGLSFEFGGRSASAGASVGVALLDGHSDMRIALEQADSAMYVRKAQRRHEVAAG